MPGVSKDMNGYRDFEQGHLRTSSYANGYDPYRRERDGMSNYPPPGRSYAGDFPTSRSGYYARSARSEILPSARSYGDHGYRRHNGVDDIEQNSFEMGMRDGNEPTFEVDHLATYTSKSGTTHPEDGLTKLKQMESSTGIWTMRCMLIVERRNIIVIDKGNGDELERFPLSHVHEPTAVLKNDRRETYNNLVLFTILDDPRRKNGPSDMHIFQSVNAPAHDIVDEILSAKGEGGGKRGQYDKHIPPPPSGPAPEPPYGKSQNLRETNRYGDPYRDEPPLEARLQETRLSETARLGETGRFNDASRWIHEYYTTGGKGRDRTPSPIRDSWRDVQTIGYSGFPEFGNSYSHRQAYRSESNQYAKPNSKSGTPFGTWSGNNFDPDTKTGRKNKKGKKWFMFSSSKNSMKKSKSGKENKGFDYSSSTLPLMRSVSSGNMYAESSNSLRRNMKSSTDADFSANILANDRQGIDMVDSGRGYGQSRVGDFRASYIHREDMDTGQNEALERDVQLLNNCFDDIEKFVSRLQQAAEAYKELERRRVERGGKRKQKSAGDGMLMMRARPPPADDFIDIFQKFKFAFNLLAKLKAHIHDPNAPELVHFLFTPLSLIYEASRDPIHGGRDLSSEAVAPLLLHDAKQLLLNCLTSKELELWQRLGRPWTLVKDEWNSSVPPYNPRFYNGWQPSPQLVDEVNQQDRLRDVQERSVPYVDPLMASRREDPYTRDIRQSERREDPYRMTDRREDPYRMTERRDDPYRSTERREDPYRMTERREDPYSREIRSDRDFGRSERRDDYNRPPSPSPPRNFDQTKRASAREPVSAPKTRAEENVLFAQDLKRMGATIYEAVHERTGKNAKELTVEKGDILQVLDKSRNWWKLKNYQGETGYAPYTILKEYQPRDDFDNGGGGQRLSGDYNSYINGGAPPAPPPPAANRPASRGEAERRQREPPAELRQNRPIPASRPHGEKSMYSEDLHNELRNKMNTSDERMSPRGREDRLSYTQDDRSYQQSSPHRHSGSYTQDDRSYPQPPPSRQNSSSPRSPVLNNRRNYNINQYSTPEEVREWIEIKGFSRRCMDLLTGYNGLDLFGLDKHELERLLGRDEGRFLDSLLMVQKNNAGFRTRGASELRAILERRKERSDTDGRRDDGFGARPSFMPETPPDYSPAESDASSDDYGDAGKTLRNLLERQRKKLQQVGYNGPYQ
ncbi:epidermal growth factor receptor kinase substrate 8-like isoform X2 [Mercenaria mercenaria]|uniref:epidermal growth factor receptor kinase substrate 8-like isoform X2 n=1 Tax=Mercenaria mercenaria TaxID=6596 RepID=UPI00234FA754|nr:epidermal growth factor receptor kinase substrate 8-like isoform X2 [Mercenaria mercenaria]